jgi:hypothetical protein
MLDQPVADFLCACALSAQFSGPTQARAVNRHDPGRKVIGFSIGDRFSYEDLERNRALWRFLAETAVKALVVKFSALGARGRAAPDAYDIAAAITR